MLPAHTRYDYAINIINRKELPFSPLYNLLERKLSILRGYLDQILKKE